MSLVRLNRRNTCWPTYGCKSTYWFFQPPLVPVKVRSGSNSYPLASEAMYSLPKSMLFSRSYHCLKESRAPSGLSVRSIGGVAM
ncbi:hypothetical protein D3C73_1610140 [compost metagenome]